MLNVGFAVAAADGHADVAELAVLTQQLEAAFSLNETEQRRLEALRGLRAANGVEMADLNRMLRDLSRQQQELVGRLMLALVAADGQVTKAELKTVRKVYSAMGWDKDAIDTAVATLLPTPGKSADGDELVTVLPATAGEAGEPIPPPPGAASAFVLNRAAIDAILRETQDVARLLADAMTPDTLGDVATLPIASSWTFLPPAPAPSDAVVQIAGVIVACGCNGRRGRTGPAGAIHRVLSADHRPVVLVARRTRGSFQIARPHALGRGRDDQ